MAFTDSTYYKGDIKLSSQITNGENTDDFDAILNDVEDKVLVDLLGYDLKSAFIAGLAEETPAQKWLDLRDGKEYEVIDSEGRPVKVKWNGFVNSDKRSLLSYFVYYYFQRDYFSQATSTGEVKMEGNNSIKSTVVDLNRKLINSWNKAIDLYGLDIENLNGSNAILKSKSVQCYMHRNIRNLKIDYYAELLKSTAYNFIYAMNQLDPATYPNWNFTEKKKQNLLGI